MTKQDYRATITGDVSASEAYDKIARVSEWWAKDFKGSARDSGDLFTVRFGETFVYFKVTEAIPDSKVIWHVTNCFLSWINNKTEWNDTNIIFEVSARPGETTITITHERLIPGIECFEDCEKGWNEYFGKSLKQLLVTGHGMPQ